VDGDDRVLGGQAAGGPREKIKKKRRETGNRNKGESTSHGRGKRHPLEQKKRRRKPVKKKQLSMLQKGEKSPAKGGRNKKKEI